MPVTVTYTCDLCGHSQNTNEQMWYVGLVISSHPIGSSYQSPKLDQLWCRSCSETRKLLPLVQEKKRIKEVEATTLEDIVRKIIQDET